jgi:hypothetical protein
MGKPRAAPGDNGTATHTDKGEIAMKSLKLMALLLAMALPLAVGCKKEVAEVDDRDDTATSVTEAEKSGVNKPGDLNPVEAQTMVDDVTIGKSVATDGTIAADQQGDDFAPGDPVYLAMKVGDAPAGSAVKVVWYGPGETRIGEEEKTVAAGTPTLSFKSGDTASWAKGDYRAEIWIGDEKVNTQQFNIVDKSEAGK